MKLSRRLKWNALRIFRVKAGSHRIALSVVTGLLPCWFPTFGIGPAISIALTKLTKGNLPAAAIAASIGSFLWPVLFYMNYVTGGLIGPSPELPEISLEDVGYNETASNLDKLSELGREFLVGGVVNSLLFSILLYGMIYYSFKHYRKSILVKLRGLKV